MQFLLLSVLLQAQEWAVNYTIDYKNIHAPNGDGE